MRGRLCVITYLNVTEVRMRVKERRRRSSALSGDTANVAKDRPEIMNCKIQNFLTSHHHFLHPR